MPMARIQNWQPVRWFAKSANRAAADLIENYHLVEHFSRALDKAGWMIVPKPEFSPDRWTMNPTIGPVAAWAERSTTAPRRFISNKSKVAAATDA